MAEEPKPNSIEDIGDARIVIDDDIADGHGRMPQPFARDQFARLSRWAPIFALHAEVGVFRTIGLD